MTPAQQTGLVTGTTAYQYDASGNATYVWSPSAWNYASTSGQTADANNTVGAPTINTYTADNLLLTTQTPFTPANSEAELTTYTYDQAGLKLSDQTSLVNPANDQVIGPPPASVGAETFAYYPDGRLKAQTGRDGSATTATAYDAAGNALSITGPGSGTLTSTYYLDSLVRTVDDGTQVTSYTYDGAGQTVGLNEPKHSGGSTTSTTTYKSNDAEMPTPLQSTVASGAQTNFTYDADGRLASETDPNSTSTAFGYDPNSAVTLKAVTTGSNTTVAQWNYTYTGGLIATQSFAGEAGTVGTLQANQFTYTYDADGRLASFQNGSAPVSTITWDHNGNRLTNAIPQTLGTSSATYTTTYAYNANNSIATEKDTQGGTTLTRTYSYDGGGRLTNDVCSSYGYDAFDRLASVSGNGLGQTSCPAPTAATTSYTYDGLGRQSSHTESGLTTTTLDYAGPSSAVAVESTASQTTSYELTAGLQSLAVTQAPVVGQPTTQYLADDGQGNISTISSVVNSTPAVDCSVRYDPFGNPVGPFPVGTQANGTCNTSTPPSPVSDKWYRGDRQDPTTGDYQLGQRTYDPSKGTFLTPDSYAAGRPTRNPSVGTDPLTANTFAYVNGDPVNLADPNGHTACGDDGCMYGAWHGRAMGDPRRSLNRDLTEAALEAAAAEIQAYGDALSRQVERQDDWAFQECGDSNACKYQYMTDNYPITFDWKGFLTGLASVAVAVVVTAACETATVGIGSIGCAAAGGATGGLVGGLMSCNGDAGCVAKDTGFGAIGGAAGGALGVALKAAASEFSPKLLQMFGIAGSTGDAGAVATEEGGSALGDFAESCATNSFTAATLVVMADGTTKAISEVKIGDRVEATDPATGKTVGATVSHLFLNDDHNLADVVVRDARGATSVLHSTQGHRFWNQTIRAWVLTDELRSGDTLLSDAGGTVTVTGLDSWIGSEWMYDLTVDGIHTFYVESGGASALVHNCPAFDPEVDPAAQAVSDIMKSRLAGITRAALPKGSPGWDDIRNMTMQDIIDGKAQGLPGYSTIWKLLTDSRFAR